MSNKNDFLEMTYKSIVCFADDGKLLVHELESLLAIALRDGAVNDDEKRVLHNIFDRLSPAELTTEMLEKIREIKSRHF